MRKAASRRALPLAKGAAEARAAGVGEYIPKIRKACHIEENHGRDEPGANRSTPTLPHAFKATSTRSRVNGMW